MKEIRIPKGLLGGYSLRKDVGMIIFFPICWLHGILDSIWYGIPLDGHWYREYKTYKTKTKVVEVLKCDLCGYESSSWTWRYDNPLSTPKPTKEGK